jgi:putative transposase
MTGIKKEPSLITTNEKEVLDIVYKYLNIYNNKSSKKKKSKEKLNLPSANKWFLGYKQLYAIFSESKNVDYKSLHSHMAQHIMKKCVNNWVSYFHALDDCKTNSNKYKAMPKIPNYLHTSMTTVSLTNQTFKIEEDENNGNLIINFPKIKDKKVLSYPLGRMSSNLSSKKIIRLEIKPYHNNFLINITYEDKELDSNTKKIDDIKDNPCGVIGIDLGVNNFAAITDNLGNNPILIKGRFLKSRNQLFNKYKAKETSALQQGENPNNKHKNSPLLDSLSIKRDFFFRDCFYKIAHKICRLAMERNVNTIVIGHNDDWKQEVKLKDKNNQNFVSIPFSQFIYILKMVAKKYAIYVVDTEESYTSQASFLDNDFIPTYKKGDTTNYTFSGKRTKRGLYVSKEGYKLNADINGSLNIIRKYLGDSIFNVKNRLSFTRQSIEVWNFNEFYPQNCRKLA